MIAYLIQNPGFLFRCMNFRKKKQPIWHPKMCVKIHRHERSARSIAFGWYTAVKRSRWKRTPPRIMCSTSRRATTKDRAMKSARACEHKTTVRNSVIAAVIVKIDFRVVDAKRNVIPSNAHAIWLSVNAIQIYVRHVVLINSIWPELRAAM